MILTCYSRALEIRCLVHSLLIFLFFFGSCDEMRDKSAFISPLQGSPLVLTGPNCPGTVWRLVPIFLSGWNTMDMLMLLGKVTGCKVILLGYKVN